MNIENVLDENDVLLVDSSTNGDQFFRSQVWHSGGMNELDYQRLFASIEAIDQFGEVIRAPNVHTIPEVTKELRKFLQRVKQKKDFYHKRRQNRPVNPDVKTAFHKYVDSINRLYHYSKRKEFKISDERYEILVDMVKAMDRALKLKEATKRNEESLDTDERLTAAAYYISMFTGLKPGILSSDGDFRLLLGVTSKLLGSYEFENNELFRESFTNSPISLYFVNGYPDINRLRLPKIPKFRPRFRVYECSREVENELFHKIQDYWDRFSEIGEIEPCFSVAG